MAQRKRQRKRKNRKKKVGRPTKFDGELAMIAYDAVYETGSFKAAAQAMGIGYRTLMSWLERGERGEEPYKTFAEFLIPRYRDGLRVRNAKAVIKRRAADQERWAKFKEGREDWWRKQLGEVEFWRRRLQWLVSTKQDKKAEKLLWELAEKGLNFRINGTS